jgi:large subunit ribosomal protein L14
MISVESRLTAVDNAGAVIFKCISVFGGFNRRYARLGEIVGSVSQTRRVYRADINKKILAKKVRKKRKQKSKKVKPNVRPYLTLLVGLRRWTSRQDGSYIKFDSNNSLTFTEPTRYGPAGKSTMIPNFIGTRVFGPVCRELRMTQ